jgi:DNA-binding response OmpR family regulator
MNPRITGNNVLIVEDETLLALMLEDLLLESGHRVVHAGSLPDAMAALDREQFDAAILDINVNGNDVFPVAMRLRELNTPFVFASASDADRIGPEFRQEQLIAKPYTIGQVQQSLSGLLAAQGA